MAKPTPSEQTKASSQLLVINDAMHQLMADIMNGLVEKDETASLDAEMVKQVHELAHQAVDILTKSGSTMTQLPLIIKLTGAVSVVMQTVPVKDGKMTMPKDAAKQLPGIIINHLANQIHDAALILIGNSGKLQGCTVGADGLFPAEATDVAKYCNGVLSAISQAVIHKGPQKKTPGGLVIQYPQIISHKLGIHHVDISTKTINGSADVAINYHESGPGYTDSKNRMKGVQKTMEAQGMKCDPQYPSLYCNGELSTDKLGQLATFFSLLLDGDIQGTGPEKPDVIANTVWTMSGELNQKYGSEVWASPQGHLDWNAAKAKYLKDKQTYENKTIYTDLRNLIVMRDRHHELEAKYGIDSGHANKKGAQEIVDNANAAIAIFKKNKWSDSGLASATAQMQSKVNAGVGNLSGVSDGVGHDLHVAISHQLNKEGKYGGCNPIGDTENVNGGNLAYCEGVLAGTSATLSKAGNMVNHQVAPNSYATFILDENPDGTYDVNLTLPKDASLSAVIKTALSKKHQFTFHGSGSTMKTTVKTLDDIRNLALILSNLRGASEKIGDLCLLKAADIADTTAAEQNKKGVFAFTQDPVMENEKAWIQACFKQFKIPPPGMTKEDQKILETIGANKIYGGCTFANAGDTVPNAGVLVYCEGVRKNPEGTVSALMFENGVVYHYMHGTTDKLADVNIQPLADGKYQVNISDIDLRNPTLQTEALKVLKETISCATDTCSGKASANGLRKMAAFLSGFHHAYKKEIDQSCLPAIVEFVKNHVLQLPDSLKAHDDVVHPWVYSEWNSEVCGKAPAVKKPPTATTTKEEVPPGTQVWNGSGPTPPTPFIYKGCTIKSVSKLTKVNDSYCNGVIGKWQDKSGTITPTKVAAMYATTAASVQASGNEHWLNGVDVVFTSKWNSLYITLPDELANIEPLTKALHAAPFWGNPTGDPPKTFQFGYAKYKAGKVASFLSHCSGLHTLPPEYWPQAVAYALKRTQDGASVIYPFKKEDWASMFIKPETPKKITLADFTVTEIDNLISGICVQKAAGKTLDETFSWFEKNYAYVEFGAGTGGYLTTQYEKCPGPKKMSVGDMPASEVKKILDAVCSLKTTAGQTKEQIFGWFESSYPNFEFNANIKFWLEEAYNMCPEPKKPEPETPSIDSLIAQESELVAVLYDKVSEADKKKMVETTVYKKLPKAVQNWLHAVMDLYLLEGHKAGDKYEDTVKKLQEIIIKQKMPIPITPLMVKLQTDIERKRKIRKGWLPAEPGEKVEKKFDNLSQDEQDEVKTEISNLIEQGGAKVYDVVETIVTKFGIESSTALIDQISHEIEEYSPPESGYVEDDIKDAVESVFAENPSSAMTLYDVQQIIGANITDTKLESVPTLAEMETAINSLMEDGSIATFEGNKGIYTLAGKKEPEEAHESPELKYWIFETLNNAGPNVWFTITGLHILLGKEPEFIVWPSIEEVQTAVEELTQSGQLLWDLSGNKWAINPNAPEATEKKAPKNILDLTPKQMVEAQHILESTWDIHDSSESMESIWVNIATAIKQKFGVPTNPTLLKWIKDGIQGIELKKAKAQADAVTQPDKVEITDASDDVLDEMQAEIHKKMLDGEQDALMAMDLSNTFGIIQDEKFNKWVEAIIAEIAKPKAKHPKDLNIIDYNQAISTASKIWDWGKSDASLKEIEVGIADELNKKFGVLIDATTLNWIHDHLHDTYSGTLKYQQKAGIAPKEEPKTPALVPGMIAANDENIAGLIKLGWSEAGIIGYFKDAMDEKTLTSKVKKLMKLWKPTGKPEPTSFTAPTPGFKQFVRGVARAMMLKGKTQEDTAWQISHDYNLVKEQVAEYVHEVAKAPLKQVAEAVELIKGTAMTSGKVYGCDAIPDNLGDLKPTVIALCQGFYNKKPSFKATLAAHGTTGILDIANEILSGYEHGQDGQFTFQLHGKSKPEAKGNMLQVHQAAAKALSKLKYNEVGTPVSDHFTVETSGPDGGALPISEQDRIRQSAIFLSHLSHVSELPDACIPKAVEYAMEKARLINKTAKPWTVEPWPLTVEDWNTMVCSKVVA